MNKCAMEIYSKIVSAPIGEPVSTRHKNGKEYNYGIEDALKEQGYTEGKEFSRHFDWATAQTFIKKLAKIALMKNPRTLSRLEIFFITLGVTIKRILNFIKSFPQPQKPLRFGKSNVPKSI